MNYIFLIAVLSMITRWVICDDETTGSTQTYPVTCRDSWVGEIETSDFLKLTCSKCYVQVFFDKKPLTLMWPLLSPYVLHNRTNESVIYEPDAFEPDSIVCKETLSQSECRQWRRCCSAAVACCKEQNQSFLKDDQSISECPRTWDGVSCWPSAPERTQVKQLCPSYYEAISVAWRSPQAERHCLENGTWNRHHEHDLEISNYDSCFDTSRNVQILRVALYIDFVGHSISITFLLSAIGILLLNRELRLEFFSRESLKIHLNLFLSVIFVGITSIPFHYLYYHALNTDNEAIFLENDLWCRGLHILTKYFRCTTYMCMFSEGLFLYRRISRLMYVNLRDPLKKYLVINWVLPLFTMSAYVTSRIILKGNERCWVDGDGLMMLDLIYMIPNVITLVCNLGFLVNIEYMLCTSMRSNTSDRRVQVLRHALRATLSLIPVFGIQFMLLVYRPAYFPPYEVIVALFTSTQGFLISILYFFSTREVHDALLSQCHQKARWVENAEPCALRRSSYHTAEARTNNSPSRWSVALSTFKSTQKPSKSTNSKFKEKECDKNERNMSETITSNQVGQHKNTTGDRKYSKASTQYTRVSVIDIGQDQQLGCDEIYEYDGESNAMSGSAINKAGTSSVTSLPLLPHKQTTYPSSDDSIDLNHIQDWIITSQGGLNDAENNDLQAEKIS